MKQLLCCLIPVFLSAYSPAQQTLLYADATRMESRILELGKFGANPQGGVSRVGFSDADREGRNYIMDLMRNAGLDVRIDAGGNIIGRREGRDNTLPAILFGSHIDSVPEGGNYDGDVGVIGSLECIELLNENDIVTNHPLEMIVFSNEEGGLIGSQVFTGVLSEDDLDRMTSSGKTIRDGLAFIGGDPDRLSSAKHGKDEYLAFIELHIEQGAVLDEKGINIGVVQGIVGIEQWDFVFLGNANHAGTTPMNKRQDALLAASSFVLSVNEIIRSVPGTQVGTVGVIKAEPGAPNVIPGKVTATLEMRDISREKMLGLFEQIARKAERIADEFNVDMEYESVNLDIYPALADQSLMEMVAQSAEELGYSHMEMPSFAGHDAQDLSKITRMAMIFVPSKDGISHSPYEFTSAEDMARGASVLLRTMLKIDGDAD